MLKRVLMNRSVVFCGLALVVAATFAIAINYQDQDLSQEVGDVVFKQDLSGKD